MLNIKNRRDPRRFWEHAWTIHLQQPKDGKFNQEDLRWSMYEGVKFAWIRYDRLEDFVKGEEENEIAPTKMNVKLKNQQRWNENSRQKCNSYIERKQYTCQYGPEKTTVLKDIIGRKRKRFGKKTGCQYHFISCRMRANDQLCCILMQVGEHIDVDGKYCHGRLGPPTDKRCHHVMFLSKELREAFAEMMRHGMSPDGVFDKYIADLLSNKDEKQFPLQTSRDEYVSRKDLLNIYANVTEEGYKLNTDDRESTRLWVENFKHFFFLFQQEDKVNDVPLIIGVQSKWMLDNMVRFSKDSIISMDSTFNTNKYKYTLHTCMVFDSHYNGLPVAWVISSRTRTSDVELWLDLLVRRCRSVDSSWKVNAFLTDDSSVEIGAIRNVVGCHIFLCTWHVSRAWWKHLNGRVNDKVIKKQMADRLKKIMNSCSDQSDVGQELQQFLKDFEQQKSFLEYFHNTWLKNDRFQMWAKPFRDVPHAQQHTNNALESYHGFLKKRFLSHRKRLDFMRIDWLLWCLHLVQVHYWNQMRMKEGGFIINHHVREQNKKSWERALAIPNEDCIYDEHSNAAYYVCSQNPSKKTTWYHVRDVYSFSIKCNCMWANTGHVCKHAIKVAMILKGEDTAKHFFFCNDQFDSRFELDMCYFDGSQRALKEKDNLGVILSQHTQDIGGCQLGTSSLQRNICDWNASCVEVGYDNNDDICLTPKKRDAKKVKEVQNHVTDMLNKFQHSLPGDLSTMLQVEEAVKKLVSTFSYTPLEDQVTSKKRISSWISPSKWKKNKQKHGKNIQCALFKSSDTASA